MSQRILHVAFGMPAAGTIRMAMKMAGRDAEVIGMPNSLNFGPIDFADSNTRSEWVEDAIGCEWSDVIDETEQFWDRVLTTEKPLVLWFSRCSAMEYTGFLKS